MADCRSCQAPILWAETVPGGRRVPLDADPVDLDSRGALVLVGRFAYSLKELAERVIRKEAVSDQRARELIGERYEAHLSHFATCPNASGHRKDRHG